MSTLEVLAFSWRSSGGVRVMLRSFDFWLAVGFFTLSAPLWLTDKWPDLVIAVLPNLLGFTLGGFAIFLGFGSDEFKGFIADSDEARSSYLSVSAAFMLFVAFQIAALLWAIVAKGMYFERPDALDGYGDVIELAGHIGGAVGYFLFAYSLALVLRAAIRIFRLSRWYNAYVARDAVDDDAGPAP